MIWFMSSASQIYDRIMGKKPAKMPQVGFMIGHQPPARNPGPPPFRMPTAPQGSPIPYIEEYADGSAKLIRGEKSEWVKRPDEGENKVVNDELYPQENLRELIHQFQLRGLIRANVASQLVAQLERDGLWVNPTSSYKASPPPTPPDFRSVKGYPSRYGMPDLEYSAIGDKSEPKTGATFRPHSPGVNEYQSKGEVLLGKIRDYAIKNDFSAEDIQALFEAGRAAALKIPSDLTARATSADGWE
jgi:hypothetical protein